MGARVNTKRRGTDDSIEGKLEGSRVRCMSRIDDFSVVGVSGGDVVVEITTQARGVVGVGVRWEGAGLKGTGINEAKSGEEVGKRSGRHAAAARPMRNAQSRPELDGASIIVETIARHGVLIAIEDV